MFNFFRMTLSILLLGSSAQAQVIAKIGDKKEISLQEFEKRYQDYVKQVMSTPPTKAEFLEDLVRYEMGLIEARAKKLDQDPVVVDRMNQELYKGLLEREVAPLTKEIKIKDKEMREWYAKNPEIRTSHILISFKTDSTPEEIKQAKERAEAIYKDVLKSKRPFPELVKLYSDDTLSKQAGGDINWQTRLTLFPTYYDAVMKLKMNELSPVVRTPFGFHIIKLTGKRDYKNADKQQISRAVFEVKRKQIFDEYFAKLKKRIPVSVSSQAIK